MPLFGLRLTPPATAELEARHDFATNRGHAGGR